MGAIEGMKTYSVLNAARPALVALWLLISLGLAHVQSQIGDRQFQRYKVPRDLKRYPQTTPKKALESVVKAIVTGDFDYLVAQLADPLYVDEKVLEYKKSIRGPAKARELVAFDKFARDVKKHLRDDPSLARTLRRLHKEGEWEEGRQRAIVRLPGVRSTGAYFVNIEDRWFLENRRRK